MTTVFTKPSMVVSLDALAVLSEVMWGVVERTQSGGRGLPAEILEEFQRMAVEGDTHRARLKGRETPDVSRLDFTDFTPVRWVSVTYAAEHLGIKRQAVTGLLDRGTLHGEQDAKGRPWRVCAESVTARKTGQRCEHQGPNHDPR